MSVFVDTSVWSQLLRRDQPQDSVQVRTLIKAIESGEKIVTTGLVFPISTLEDGSMTFSDATSSAEATFKNAASTSL